MVILTFRTDGKYTGAVVLDQEFEPQQLASFGDGVFLVSGIKAAQVGTNTEFAPYLALFDRWGRVIRRVDTAEPTYVPGRRQDGTKKKQEAERQQDREEHLAAPPELGLMQSDGTHVYLLRQGDKPIILAISSAGEVDDKLILEPPVRGTQVSTFRVGQGQILVEYFRPHGLRSGNTAYNLLLYDASSGARVAEYTRTEDVTGTLACTDWRGHISLLTANDQGPILLKAGLR